jgi:hypothetical protein
VADFSCIGRTDISVAFERGNFSIYFSFPSFGINFVLLCGKSKRWDVAVNGGTEDKKGLKKQKKSKKTKMFFSNHEM